MNTVCSRSGGVGALAVALLALPVACYPNPDDLRTAHGAGGLGGASGASGGAGIVGGVGGNGPPGAGGRVGTGGSGGAGSAQCGAPACGGNLLGTWRYVSTCLLVGHSDCGEVLDITGIHRSGSVTFNSNGTYSTTTTNTGTLVLDEPTACLSGLTCVDVQSAFAAETTLFSSASCSATATGCHCLLAASGTPQLETGTYSASGTSLTTTSSTGDVNADTYCVSGSSLRLIYEDSTPAMPDESLFAK